MARHQEVRGLKAQAQNTIDGNPPLCRSIDLLSHVCKADEDAPIGETIPIRLFLGGFDLTPTFREVNKKYSTRYYLSLVLIDEGKV